jgi:hypothetical protein
VITIFEAAAELQGFCEDHGWRACFIGGIAVQRWSQARVTRDIDITLLTGFGHETPFIEDLLAITPRELPTRRNSPCDLEFCSPTRQAIVKRAAPFEFVPGHELRTCSAEDLVVMKLFACASLKSAMPKVLPYATTNARLALHRRATHSARRSHGRAEDPAGTCPGPQPQCNDVRSFLTGRVDILAKGVERVSTRHAECVRHVGAQNSHAQTG